MKIRIFDLSLEHCVSLTHIFYFAHLLCWSASNAAKYEQTAAGGLNDGVDVRTAHDKYKPRIRDSGGLHVSQQYQEAINMNSTQVPSEVIVTNCYAFIDEFAEDAAHYTRCAIRNARPVTFCQHCVKAYVTANESFSSIMEDGTVDNSNRKCKDLILNSDRVQLVIKTKIFIDSLWDECRCKGCFSHYDFKNETVEVTTSNDTIRFFELINATNACFRNYSQGYIEPVGSNSTNNGTLVCNACKKLYQDLNDFYAKLGRDSAHQVCMDIVDSMNFTRILWSKDFRCHKKNQEILVVVLISTIFCLLPITFYAASRIHGGKAEKKVLKEKRLKDSTIPEGTEDAPSTSGVAINNDNNQ